MIGLAVRPDQSEARYGVCPVCGGEFTIRGYGPESWKVFCSAGCRNMRQSVLRNKDSAEAVALLRRLDAIRQGPKPVRCRACNGWFVPRRGQERLCSDACRALRSGHPAQGESVDAPDCPYEAGRITMYGAGEAVDERVPGVEAGF